KIIQAINAEGIPCFTGSCPEIYREKAFSDYNIRNYEILSNAKLLGETSLMLLVHPTLDSNNIKDMANTLKKISGIF
ncbi:MAG: aminotransferase, partial [Candidatus Dadabacteria bacterium]|nr:aminotransferase [Candidatus Dadabacteria bacterium]